MVCQPWPEIMSIIPPVGPCRTLIAVIVRHLFGGPVATSMDRITRMAFHVALTVSKPRRGKYLRKGRRSSLYDHAHIFDKG